MLLVHPLFSLLSFFLFCCWRNSHEIEGAVQSFLLFTCKPSACLTVLSRRVRAVSCQPPGLRYRLLSSVVLLLLPFCRFSSGLHHLDNYQASPCSSYPESRRGIPETWSLSPTTRSSSPKIKTTTVLSGQMHATFSTVNQSKQARPGTGFRLVKLVNRGVAWAYEHHTPL